MALQMMDQYVDTQLVENEHLQWAAGAAERPHRRRDADTEVCQRNYLIPENHLILTAAG